MSGISGDFIVPSAGNEFLALVPSMFEEIRYFAIKAAQCPERFGKIKLLAEMMKIVNNQDIKKSLEIHAPGIGPLTPELCGFRIAVGDFYELMKCIFKNSPRFIKIETLS
jgi:hypothetical protein